MDNSIEQKIYGQQVGKQAMADRVVDELDLEAHVSLKDFAKIWKFKYKKVAEKLTNCALDFFVGLCNYS